LQEESLVARTKTIKTRRATKPAAKGPPAPDENQVSIEEFEREGMGVAPKE
jgi:hypothetical protein